VKKPLQNNIQHDINDLLYFVKSTELSKDELTEKIVSVLTNTYQLISSLEEKQILNPQVSKFEKDNTSFKPYANKYKKLLEQANENEDRNLAWRCNYAINFFKESQKNTNKMLSMQKIIIASNYLLEDVDFHRIHMSFLNKHNPKEYHSVMRNIQNKDLFIELYGLFEGYKLSKMKILKSAGLKIFNFFHYTTKTQKKALATQIEYIFATLGEDIGINIKRATNIRPIAEFYDNIIIDYGDNKKDPFVDEELQKLMNSLFMLAIHQIEQSGNKKLANEIKNILGDLESLFFIQMLS